VPANETPERLAAAAWIRISPGVEFTAESFGLRCQVSCQNRLIITSLAGGGGEAAYAEAPFIILPLDRTFTRRETTLHAQLIQTPDDTTRVDYPWSIANNADFDETDVNTPDTRLLYCPLHLDWIGDLTAPSWLPFNLGLGVASAVPAGFDLDLYNAVGFAPYSVAGAAVGLDIIMHVFKHPVNTEGGTFAIDETLVIPVAG